MAMSKYVGTWLATNDIRSQICDAYMQKGGVEGWLQVELALALMPYYRNVEREVAAYNINARADLVCTKATGSASAAAAAETFSYELVELKCASLFQDASSAQSFVNRINADFTKISTANAVTNKATTTECIAIGVSVANPMTEAVWTLLGKPMEGTEKPNSWSVVSIYAKDWIDMRMFYRACKPT